jgi:hypothetical protein
MAEGYHKGQADANVQSAIVNVAEAWAQCGLAGLTSYDERADVIMTELRCWLYELQGHDEDGAELPEQANA